MNLLPQASGTRPRVACEISAEGVVAARSAATAGPLASVARASLAPGAVAPGLKPGNLVDRVAVVAAVRRVLGDMGSRGSGTRSGLRPNARGGDMTLIIPDAAARVLLLEFDSLPNKLSEALPLVRFRLKKLLPFDGDEAMITFQVMSHARALVRVLAVAMPRDVLAEYETAAREAGFEPGAVLPSTLAALAALPEDDPATLLVNANRLGITTAIVREGILLLHRTVDLQEHAAGTPAGVPPALFERSLAPGFEPDAGTAAGTFATLPLIDRHTSAAEYAAQAPVPEHGRDPYADRAHTEETVQNEDSITGLPLPERARGAREVPERHDQDLAEAVSVAAAYFEDTLSIAPRRIVSAGPLGADALRRVLVATGVAETEGLQVRELVEAGALEGSAASSAAPRNWLAGVLGALRG